MSVKQWFDAVEAEIKKLRGSVGLFKKVNAKLLYCAFPNQSHTELKWPALDQGLGVVGNRSGKASAAIDANAEPLRDGKQFAAHGDHARSAAQGKRAKHHHLHRIAAQDASSVPFPNRRTTLKAISGAGSSPRFG